MSVRLGRIGYRIGKNIPKPKELAHKDWSSVCVADLQYDPLTQECVCVFQKRGTYKYNDMTPDIFAEWNTSSSRGTYFNLYVRNQYDYERIG